MDPSSQEILTALGSAFSDLLDLMGRLLPIFITTIVLANLMRLSPRAQKLSLVMLPLCKLARLPRDCSQVFITTLMNRGAGLFALAGLLEKGGITPRQVKAVYLCSYLPLCIRQIVFTAGPISFPMLGVPAALAFLASLLAIGVIRFLTGVMYARQLPEAGIGCPSGTPEPTQQTRLGWPHLLKRALLMARGQFLRILLVMIPTLFIALFLIKSGLMQRALLALDPGQGVILGLPAISYVLIISAIPSTIAGVSAAGALLSSGDILPDQAVLSLLCAHFFNRLYLLARTWTPLLVMLFGTRLGLDISLAAVLTELVWLPGLMVFLLLYF